MGADETDFAAGGLAQCRVLVWGLGLMGGSLALALRGHCAEILGVDQDANVVAEAQARGVVDRAFSVEQARSVPWAMLDLVVLAVPVRGIIAVLENMANWFPAPLVVVDLGSTKAAVMAAMETLPVGFGAVGGHPMCGKEIASLAAAEASLYQGAPFYLVENARTTPAAAALVEAMVAALGARAQWVTADIHDRWVAATSHVPFLISSALAGATPQAAAAMVGPGFRSTARLAGSSPRMMADILATNAENIQAALANVRDALADMDTLLQAGDFARLAEIIVKNEQHYQDLVHTEPVGMSS